MHFDRWKSFDLHGYFRQPNMRKYRFSMINLAKFNISKYDSYYFLRGVYVFTWYAFQFLNQQWNLCRCKLQGFQFANHINQLLVRYTKYTFKTLEQLLLTILDSSRNTVYPKKYAHGFFFAVLCCGYTLTDFPISIRLTSLALWQSNDCPSASKATLMNMDKYFMWIHYERLHNHNKAKHNKTVCIFIGIYCISDE